MTTTTSNKQNLLTEKVCDFINQGRWTDAKNALKEALSQGMAQDETYFILEASIAEGMADYAAMFSAIRAGLSLNPENYELYLLLGNYYTLRNPNQAYLCYENAVFHCHSQNDLPALEMHLQTYYENHSITVQPMSIVMLSYNNSQMTKECVQSIRDTLPKSSYELIIIDNASSDGITKWLSAQSDIHLIANSENAGFPAGCNQGIKASAPDNDIFLLNNDTLLPPNAVFWLRMGLYEAENIGSAGSVTNFSSNFQQVCERTLSKAELFKLADTLNLPSEHPYEQKMYLVGFALLIKRNVLDQIGLLDTRFSPGNYEDTDLGIRIAHAGYKQLLCHNSFILHLGSQSFAKDIPKYSEILTRNQAYLHEKYGMELSYYFHVRNDVLSFITAEPDARLRILEIGCGLGCTLSRIQYLYPNAGVEGIELNPDIVRLGKSTVNIRQGNIETMELTYPTGSFDYIIFADVLEHLRDPEAVLKRVRPLLKKGGSVVASLPNIMHYTVVLPLLLGQFSYEDSGILDRTHLRFFTPQEGAYLFSRSGYTIEPLKFVTQPIPLSDRLQTLKDQLTALPQLSEHKNLFDVYQFLVKATPSE